MPKTGTGDLFELIKSLTPQEKIYFKTSYSSVVGHPPVHIRLFDILNGQSVYNEKLSRKILEISNLRYANVKRYLYRSIMQSIRSYHRSKRYKSKIREMFDDYDILYNKNLYSQAEKILSKAIRLALKYDLHIQAIEGYRNYYHLKIESADVKWIRLHVKDLFLDIENTVQKLSNLTQYLKNESQIIMFLSRYSDVVRSKDAKAEFQRMKTNFRGLKKESQALSDEGRMRYNFQRGVISYLDKQPRKSIDFFKAAKRIFEEDEGRIKQSFKGYLNLISNIFSSGIGLLSYEELKNILIDMDGFSKYWVPENFEAISSYYTNLLYLHIYYKRYNETIRLINEIIEWLEKSKKEKFDRNMLYIHYYLATCYFFNERYEDSLLWMNKIINKSKPDHSEHIYSTLKIVNIIIHLELGSDNDFLGSIIKSVRRYFLKNKTAFNTEMILLKFFHQITRRSYNDSELLIEFKKLQLEIETVFEKSGEEWAYKEFDYLFWIEHKIKRLEV
ncbi:MAG: hypothetical protein JNL63_07690 [Bacteroidia bacterium]|nr:hypothetical protein [Bacteroidia bacterium]